MGKRKSHFVSHYQKLDSIAKKVYPVNGLFGLITIHHSSRKKGWSEKLFFLRILSFTRQEISVQLKMISIYLSRTTFFRCLANFLPVCVNSFFSIWYDFVIGAHVSCQAMPCHTIPCVWVAIRNSDSCKKGTTFVMWEKYFYPICFPIEIHKCVRLRQLRTFYCIFQL